MLFDADVFFISLMSSLYLQSRLVNSPTEPWGGTPSTLSGMILDWKRFCEHRCTDFVFEDFI